jgi:hypothetical protein
MITKKNKKNYDECLKIKKIITPRSEKIMNERFITKTLFK